MKNWDEKDSIIACRRAYLGIHLPDIVYLKCELCKHEISAAPVTKEKQGKPGWHVICRECLQHVSSNNEVKLMGRIQRGDETLP